MRKKILWILALLIVFEVGMRVAGWFYLRDLYQQAGAQPGDVNLVCLGESSTQGLWLDFKDSYPKQLEASLRKHFNTENIRTIIPPHVGQNTSQMANRIADYLSRYEPKLLVVMAGVNNEWALGESHITKFLGGAGSSWSLATRIRGLIWLDNLRLFKVMRYLYVRHVARDPGEPLITQTNYVWGDTEYYRYPPPSEIYAFARENMPAFVKLWEYDLRVILDASRKANVPVVLMTYHIHPPQLKPEILEGLAKEYGATVVRNDRIFETLIEDKSIDQYLLHDHWHPNARGYRIIADNLLREIVDRKLLALPSGAAPPSVTAR